MFDGDNNKIADEDIYKSTSRLLLDHAKMQYAELSETWRDLERKAQGTVAIAGLFATGLALIIRIHPTLKGDLKLFVLLSFTCLIISSIQAVFVMFVTEVTCMEDSGIVLEDAENIFDSQNDVEAKKSIRKFVMNRLRYWEEAISDLDGANSKKASSLVLAQGFLLGSISFFMLVLILGVMYA